MRTWPSFMMGRTCVFAYACIFGGTCVMLALDRTGILTIVYLFGLGVGVAGMGYIEYGGVEAKR